MNIIEAIDDPNLFAPWFKEGENWHAWRAVLKAIFAIPMDEGERAVFERIAGNRKPPFQQVKESWWVIGRRGGKSFIIALIGVFLACFHNYSDHLSPGEKGLVVIIAADRKQARVIFRYVLALIENVPMLKALIVRSDKESIELSNNLTIEIHTASYRAIRGYTIVAGLLDEVAFWRSDDSANPDNEILSALRPATATVPNAMIIGIGSPYRRSGVLYDAHRQHFGQNTDDVLVLQADTRTMNPSVPQAFIDRAYERDPTSAAAEYGALFRTDIEGLLRTEWIDSAIQPGRNDLPFMLGTKYHAFVDPSGGGQDSFTLGIAHREKDTVVIDAVRSRKPPFAPSDVVAEFSKLLKSYGLYTITGDRYAGQWPVEAFYIRGIRYQHSKLSKSEIYLEAEPVFAQGRVELPDNKKLIAELRHLERRTSRSGRDSVDHPPGGHDDVANSVCGVMSLTAKNSKNRIIVKDFITGRRKYPHDYLNF